MERKAYIPLSSLEARLQSLIDLVESMKGRDRILEERLAYIEDDITKIRFEIRRMREMMEELYQKTQQSAKDQRIRRKYENYTSKYLSLNEMLSEKAVEKERELLGLSITEEKILRLLLQDSSYGVEGATGIAKMLGMAREHIARTMKRMVDKGLLIRDETKMPFTYRVPEEIKKKLLEKQ
ncbi:MAG: helix-turn-helix domain-containing protein [Thermoprotei archaeon]